MKPRTFWIGLFVAVAFCLAAAYFALQATVTGSYRREHLEVAQQELRDLAALVPLGLTPDQLSRTAQQKGIVFRTLAASDYSPPPPGAHTVCFYGSLTFFFGPDGRVQELHGPLLERNPLFQWR